ncbi:MAG: HPF/RaiA family ribosome-associated protein [Chromatiales bacterium]|jgi:ribosome-associated translation inhibitor RaiA|nr:HPF/RaiA family ribosome-associated protein [Chromatiales bacterium]
MQVQVNTDSNIQGRDDVTERVKASVVHALERFGERITRVEVHLSDENSTKAGAADKRCLLEARLPGMQPVIASHHADGLPQAIDGALDKLRRALESAIGKHTNR